MKSGSKQAVLARWMRPVHVYCSLFMLAAMLFFTLTGLTLNHREWLPAAPKAQLREVVLPAELAASERWQKNPQQMGREAWRWLEDTQGLTGIELRYDWSDDGVMLIDAKRPGGYVLAEVRVNEGVAVIENHRKGFFATLNDLHMGRYSPALWRGFIDFFAVLMLLFTLSGLYLVVPQRKRRTRLFGLAAAGGVLLLGLHWFAI